MLVLNRCLSNTLYQSTQNCWLALKLQLKILSAFFPALTQQVNSLPKKKKKTLNLNVIFFGNLRIRGNALIKLHSRMSKFYNTEKKLLRPRNVSIIAVFIYC